MDSVIIIGLVGLFVATNFAIVYFLPTMLTKWRASAMGFNLTYGQVRIITKDFCDKKEFLLIVKDIWIWADISVDKLTNHFNAKGDLINLRD